MLHISLIICTHNPREDYLRRVLDGLNSQTLGKEEWELLLIDNASKEPLNGKYDLSWHPNARYVREEELGLTPARLRGIHEACADIVVFVDDDNVLAVDYLAVALELMCSRPWIGALGGRTIGEFETKPDSWWEGRFENLAIVDVKKEAWACLAGLDGIPLFTPCGAGMVIRRTVAASWAEGVSNDPLRLSLGRKGKSLNGFDDIDMVLFVCSIGLAIGRFPQLALTHLIPAERLEASYFIRLTEGNATSFAILLYAREGILPNLEEQTHQPCRSERLLRFYQRFRKSISGGEQNDTLENELISAVRRGKQKALRIIEEFQKSRG